MNKDTRHGDCSLWLVDGLPLSAMRVSDDCRCEEFELCAKHGALAHGEVSGHTHLLEEPLPVYVDDEGDHYVVNNTDKPVGIAQTTDFQKQADIEHLERCYAKEGVHAPIKDAIAPGETRKVVFPQEYNWFEDSIERARD